MEDAPAQPLDANEYVYGGAEPDKPGRPENLAQYICDLVAINQDGVFVEISSDGRLTSNRFHDLFRRANSLKAVVSRQTSPGAPLLLCYGQVSEYIPAAWSCLLGSRDFLPVAVSPLYRDPDGFARQIATKAEMLGADCILADSESADALRDAFADQAIGLDVIETSQILTDTPEAGPSLNLFTEVRAPSSIFIETSGSTGIPKIARLGGESLIYRFFDGIGRDDRVMLNVLSSQSVGGMRLLLPLGRKNIFLHPSLLMANPKVWFDALEDHGVTDVGLTNSMVNRLYQYIEAGGSCDARSVKRLAFGAEPIQRSVITKFLSALKQAGMADATVSLVYSMTETGPIFTSSLPAASLSPGVGQEDHGYTFDRCAASWSVRVRKDDGGLALHGETGVVEVFSSTRLFSGYLASCNDFFPDGWFSTGDRGFLSAEGLRLVGREKNTLIVHGRKITCEEIEAQIAPALANEGMTGIAVAYRSPSDETDRLGLIIVGEECDSEQFQRLSMQLSGIVSRSFAVPIGFIGLRFQDEIPRTLTGKVQRQVLAGDILSGSFDVVFHRKNPVADINADLFGDGLQDQRLARIWLSVLKTDSMLDFDHDFYALGGDSLAMMDLLIQVEREFGVRVPVREFLKSPTLVRLISLVESSLTVKEAEVANLSERDLVILKHRHLSEVWKGQRSSVDGLISARNVTGSRSPIFWVFQSEREFEALASALGPDQPLYGMRSLAGIVPTARYAPHHADIGELLALEMSGLLRGRQFVVGGNCQASIIALDVARRLVAAGSPPRMLVLMEWSFSFGSYAGPTLMLYGGSSQTASLFDGDDRQQVWRHDFPVARVAALPGGHGHFFTPTHVSGLAGHLLKLTV